MKARLPELIEAALFFKGGALSTAELAQATGVSKEEVATALAVLQRSLEERGVRLVRERDYAALATAPEAHEFIERMRKDELEGPLGKAGLETLSVIIFRGPITKTDIDYVRGVNCASILRSLMIRGLIERVENPKDKRSFLYQVTPDLPAYLGVGSVEKMPGYAETRLEIEKVFVDREALLAKEKEEDHE